LLIIFCLKSSFIFLSSFIFQISSIYESITLERLAEIILFYNRMQLEQFLVDICKQHSVSAHIDHRQNCIYFGPEDAILASELESENGNISEVFLYFYDKKNFFD
jgi:hypothetical protein